MKWLGRILWLLLGLLWRLVVLLLFEKWVPFPGQEPAAPAKPPAARKKKRARVEARESAREHGEGAPKQAARRKQAPRPPLFTAELGAPADARASTTELSPALAAQREGEHWLKPRALRVPPPARDKRENLAALLRDRSALRDAVVLGAALGVRRSKP